MNDNLETRRHRSRRKSAARLQPDHELRRLPAAGRHPRRATAALARARRDAVHHPAPDQRAVDEADAARAARGDCQRGAGRTRQRLQEAGAREQDHGAAGPRLGRAGHHDAARIQRHPPLPGQLQRLSERAIPLHRVRAGQQERRHAQAPRAPARPAGAGAGRFRGAFAVRRSAAPAGPARPARACQPHRARLDPGLCRKRRGGTAPG